MRQALVVALIFVGRGLSASCSRKPSGNDVAASVDGQKIYRADLEKYFARQTAGSNQPLSDEQATSLRLSILRELIENEILMHRAEKLGLLATDEEVDRKLSEIKSPYTEEVFRTAAGRNEKSQSTTSSATSAAPSPPTKSCTRKSLPKSTSPRTTLPPITSSTRRNST